MSALDGGQLGHVWPAIALVVMLWASGHQGRVGSALAIRAQFDDKRFPVKAVDVLASQSGGGAVFCPDRWGGYLIYRLYPGVLVAADDRHDLYGVEYLKRYLKIQHGEPGWESALREMNAGWVVFPADSTVESLLVDRAHWKVVYRDDTAVLFRSGGGN